jgi:hypothetical protein
MFSSGRELEFIGKVIKIDRAGGRDLNPSLSVRQGLTFSENS